MILDSRSMSIKPRKMNSLSCWQDVVTPQQQLCVAASVCSTTHTVSHLVMTPVVTWSRVWMRAWADTRHLSQMPETHLQTWRGLSHHFSRNHALRTWGWRRCVQAEPLPLNEEQQRKKNLCFFFCFFYILQQKLKAAGRPVSTGLNWTENLVQSPRAARLKHAECTYAIRVSAH